MSKYKDLEIEIPQEEIEDQVCIHHVPLSQIRNLSSQKNLHDLKKLQCQAMPGNLVINLKIKLMNKKKLQKQKSDLIKQYERLKKGAIQAIMQKEDMIQSLKQKCENYELYGGEQHLNQLQQQLQKHLNHILQLQNERDELKFKIQNERNLYMQDIQIKSQMISTLWKQLQIVQQELQKIETKEATTQLKLRITQEQNQKLIRSLYQTQENFEYLKVSYSQNNSRKQSKQIQAHLSDSGNQYQNKGQQSENQNFQEISEELKKQLAKRKLLSSPTSSASTKPHNFDKFFKGSYRQNDPQIYFAQQLQEQKKSHRRQIQHLNRHYAQELQKLKIDIQKRYIELQQVQQKAKEKKQFSKIVELNFDSDDSQQQFIQKNLQNEELQENQPISIHKVLKNCDSAQNLIIDVKDIEVEPNPNSPLQTDRTNLSKQSFILTNQSVSSMKSQNQIIYQQDQLNQQQCSQNMWTKKVCFVLGVITGGSLVVLVSKILYANN